MTVLRSPAGRPLGTVAAALALTAATAAGPSHAATPANPCVGMADDAQRLACYDRLHGRAEPEVLLPALEPATAPAVTVAAPETRDQQIRRQRVGSTLEERWELGDGRSLGSFLPRPYKPIYLLPVTVTDHINLRPTSPAPDHSVPVDLNLDRVEAKYQLSLKFKVWQGILGTRADLWGAYTQSSRWQIYNADESRPFRETNYEPEVMVVVPTNYRLFGFDGKMAAISLTHQSNGRSLPLSRSWNRVIGEVGLERGDWTVALRPWWRLSEPEDSDDNPDIEDYIGRGELLVTRRLGNHIVTLQARHSLRGGDRSRGSAQIDWAFPITDTLHGYLQLFSGYGESLIDYNISQTRIGLGFSVVEWR